MKRIILILLTCIWTASGFSQKNTITDHARQLLELTGSANLGIQVMNNMIASFKKQLPNVPGEFWDEFSKEINPQDLVDLIVPIYAKYYTDEELTKLIEFYKSPLGQKVVEKLPLITQDSYTAGENWGRKISEKVATKLKEKGYIQNN